MSDSKQVLIEFKTKFDELKDIRKSFQGIIDSVNTMGEVGQDRASKLREIYKSLSTELDNVRRTLSRFSEGTDLSKLESHFAKIEERVRKLKHLLNSSDTPSTARSSDFAPIKEKDIEKGLTRFNDTAPIDYSARDVELLKQRAEEQRKNRQIGKTWQNRDKENEDLVKQREKDLETINKKEEQSLQESIRKSKTKTREEDTIQKTVTSNLTKELDVRRKLEEQFENYRTTQAKNKSKINTQTEKEIAIHEQEQLGIQRELLAARIAAAKKTANKEDTNTPTNLSVSDKIDTKIGNIKNSVKEASEAITILKSRLKDMNVDPSVSTGVIQQTQNMLKGYENFVKGVEDGNKRIQTGLRALPKSFEDVKNNMVRLFAFQAEWYATRALLLKPIAGFAASIKEGIQFSTLIDEWTAKFLRWDATSGKITNEARENAKGMVQEIRKTALEYPVPFEKLAASVEAFRGAGLDPTLVKQLIPYIAQLKTGFKEINIDQFAIAVVGAFNTFKDKLIEGGSDVEKFKKIFDLLMKAQEMGIIRPENFQTVLQYFGQIADIAGFSMQEMLAMANVATDVGSRTGIAMRGLRQLLISFTKDSTLQTLEKQGIKINADISPAQQFLNVLKQIKEKLGGDEKGIAVKSLNFLQKIAPANAEGTLLAIIQNLEKYEKQIVAIGDASGGTKAASDSMLDAIISKWDIFKNVMKEVSKSSIDSEGLASVVRVILDMASGLLYALNPTLATANALDKMGEGGKFVYDTIRNLKEMFSVILTVLSPFLITLKYIVEVLGGLGTVVRSVIEGWLIYKGVFLVIHTLMLTFGPILVTIIDLLAKLKLALTTMSLSAFINPWTALAAAIGIGVVALLEFTNSARQTQESIKALTNDIEKMTKAELDSAIIQRENLIGELGTKAGSGNISNYDAAKLRSQQKKAEEELKVLQNYKDNVLNGNTPYTKEFEGTKPSNNSLSTVNTSKPNTGRGIEMAATKKTYAAILNEVEQYYKNETDIVDENRKKNEESEIETFTIKKQLLKDHAEMTIFYLNEEETALKKLYKEQVSSGMIKPEAMKATQEQLKAELDRIESLKEKAKTTSMIGIRTQETEEYNFRKRIGLEQVKFVEDMVNTMTKNEVSTQNEKTRILNEKIKWLYDNYKVTAKDYFDSLKTQYDEEYQGELKIINDEETGWQNTYKKRLENVKKGLEDELKLFEENEKKKEEIKNKRSIVDLKNEQNQQKLILERIDSPRDKDSLSGIYDLAIKDQYKQFKDLNENIYTLFKSTWQNVANSFESIFNDMVDGTLKSFQEYITNFLKSIVKEINKVVASEITKGLMGNSSSGNGILGWFSNFMKSDTTSDATKMHQGGIIPVFHSGGGLRADERLIKAQTGEGVLSRDGMSALGKLNNGGGLGSDVTVNVNNTSKTPMEAKTNNVKFDGKKVIVDVILSEISSNYGPLRHAVKSVRG